MKAFVFPGQGAQFPGMGKDLYENSSKAKELFDKANDILGFSITDIMFDGSQEELKQTKVTQPAIFLHSVITALANEDTSAPAMVAGHSLGEFSALVVNNVLQFEDALKLVAKRADAMQKACEENPSTMAAILGLDNEIVEEVCNSINEIVVPANYNCPGQLVISGTNSGIDTACEKLTEKGARRALKLPVGGAFHSPLMAPAQKELESAIDATHFSTPTCPIYQNVVAKGVTDVETIKSNLKKQLTAPVLWTQTMQQMLKDGANEIVEVGPGKVLQGLFKKVDRKLNTLSLA